MKKKKQFFTIIEYFNTYRRDIRTVFNDVLFFNFFIRQYNKKQKKLNSNTFPFL